MSRRHDCLPQPPWQPHIERSPLSISSFWVPILSWFSASGFIFLGRSVRQRTISSRGGTSGGSLLALRSLFPIFPRNILLDSLDPAQQSASLPATTSGWLL